MNFSNSSLLTSFFDPTYKTKGQFGSRSILEILLMPILLYAAASGIVNAIFKWMGTTAWPLLLFSFIYTPFTFVFVIASYALQVYYILSFAVSLPNKHIIVYENLYMEFRCHIWNYTHHDSWIKKQSHYCWRIKTWVLFNLNKSKRSFCAIRCHSLKTPVGKLPGVVQW